MITYIKEMCFDCDEEEYYADCEKYLILTQLDAKTKKGMEKLGSKLGWTWDKEKSFCPACSKRRKII